MSYTPSRSGNCVDGIWYCRCGNKAKSLVSRQDISKGRRFSRCKNSDDNDCKFFVWEDEPIQRDASREEDQPAASQEISSSFGPQTPHTPCSSRNGSNLISTYRSFDVATRHNEKDLSSPTPNRKDDTWRIGNSPLTKDVLNVLQSDNVLLKSSTREQLRRLIDSEVRIYETKLDEFQKSVSVLGDKLDKLENEGNE